MTRRATEARMRSRARRAQRNATVGLPHPRAWAARRLAAVACAVAVVAVVAAGAAFERADLVSRQAAAAVDSQRAAQSHALARIGDADAARIRELQAVTIDAKQVFSRADPSIVTIYCDLVDGAGQGTGFAVDIAAPAGYATTIVTAAHVISGCGQIRIYAAGKYDWVEAKVLAVDRKNDVASLAVKSVIPALKAGGRADQAQPVVSIGAPYGYSDSLTEGVVTTVYEDLIITDNSVNPGNSGGPLLDASGHVLGIARAKLLGGGTLGEFVPMELTCVKLFRDCPFG